MQPRRPYGRLAIAVFLLAIIGVLALNLAPLPAVRLPPESQVVARFHSLAVNDRQLQAALQLVYAYDPKSVLRAVPRVRELLARLPAGTSRLEFQGSPRQVRPGVKAVDVREIFRTANETRQSDLTVILQQEEAGCLIHAHLSSPLIWEDPDRLPRPPDTYFATPLQAVLNACHLATDEEAWWRLIPRLARLG